jgi:hypothetical protein
MKRRLPVMDDGPARGRTAERRRRRCVVPAPGGGTAVRWRGPGGGRVRPRLRVRAARREAGMAYRIRTIFVD